MNTRCTPRIILVLLLLGASMVPGAYAQGSMFTYQGQLKRSGSPTNGPCDLRFDLFDAEQVGTQIGPPNLLTGTTVTNGLFTVSLDFGANAFRVSDDDFFAAPRWLQVGVRCPAGSGTLSTLSPRQLITAAPHALYAPLIATDVDGNPRAIVDTFPDGSGLVRTRGPAGNATVLISSLEDPVDNGFISVYANGEERAAVLASSSGAGVIRTKGPNGNENIYLGSLEGNPNNGYISVADANGDVQAAMFVNQEGKGEFFAEVKNFAVDHPTRPGAKIVYTSLEGPEAAIYDRGVVKLRDGRATIELPEHFTALANPDTITVQLTPGSFDSEGLAFGAIGDGRIEVRELHKGRGSYDVHFVVHALRRGYEDRSPVIANDVFRSQYSRVALGAGGRRPEHAAQVAQRPAAGAKE